jgi:hypothetical protein
MSQSCFYLKAAEADSQGNSSWQDSGITLSSNEFIQIKAGGAATVEFVAEGPIAVSGPEGFSSKLVGSLDASLAFGALIGRINGGTPFIIGERWESSNHEGGKLELAYNDSLATDNKGGFFVGINVES